MGRPAYSCEVVRTSQLDLGRRIGCVIDAMSPSSFAYTKVARWEALGVAPGVAEERLKRRSYRVDRC